MKQTKSMKFITFTTVSLVALSLGACQDDRKPNTFSDVDSCSHYYPEATCKNMMASAKEQHQKSAPTFSKKEECENQFGVGKCETQASSGGGSVFLPIWMGYMMGRMTRDSSSYYTSSPVYFGKNGNTFTSTNSRATTPVTGARSVSRGGFGSTGRSFSVGA